MRPVRALSISTPSLWYTRRQPRLPNGRLGPRQQGLLGVLRPLPFATPRRQPDGHHGPPSRARLGRPARGLLPLGSALALVLSACVPFARPGVPEAAGDLVLVQTSSGVAGVNTGQGRIAFTARGGVPTRDWETLFAVTAGTGGENRLGVLDGRTGRERAGSLFLPKGFEPRVVSLGERLLALTEPRVPGAIPGMPAGRERTTLFVVDRSADGQPRRFDLPGNLEPEAFSLDDRRLFVIDYLPAQAPERYRVRQLDLATGTLMPVGGIKGPVPEEEMRGRGRMQVLSPDGTRLYTLYTHQQDHLHARDLKAGLTTARGDVHAFVHVLNLQEGWAFCLDLPRPMGEGPASAHAIGIAPDGRTLYVADRSSGQVAVLDPYGLRVARTADVGPDPRPERGAAAIAVRPDGRGLFLGGGSEILALDAALKVQQRWAIADAATGLGLSADGARLYLSQDGRLSVLDASSGTEFGTVAAPDVQTVRHVTRLT